ncbi:hypothetical protein EJ110_NYTH22263 [Nymphaea thermarum]|nr:hypothetical protein EJ110_NYTH22263 [Nymphaea thermarum]
MASNFDRWEKDPFFPAAEEVQDSADRMESTFREWAHDRERNLSSHELQRELQTGLGTTKWQLEEFEKAVGLGKNSQAKETVARHKQFVVALRGQISKIEDSLKESVLKDGKTSLPWVQFDEGERDELALFLAGDSGSHGRVGLIGGMDDKPGTLDKESSVQKSGVLQTSRDEGRCDLNYAVVLDLADASNVREKDDRRLNGGKSERIMNGHRRAASANADFGVWKIAVADDELLAASPSKIVNLSGLIKHIEASSKLKWSKNGFKKMKNADHHLTDNVLGCRSHPLSRAMHACYERSSSCLDSCSIEPEISYDKQLHGWLGAVQRQLQRSQYHIQYSRHFQVAFWLILAVCLIGVVELLVIVFARRFGGRRPQNL